MLIQVRSYRNYVIKIHDVRWCYPLWRGCNESFLVAAWNDDVIIGGGGRIFLLERYQDFRSGVFPFSIVFGVTRVRICTYSAYWSSLPFGRERLIKCFAHRDRSRFVRFSHMLRSCFLGCPYSIAYVAFKLDNGWLDFHRHHLQQRFFVRSAVCMGRKHGIVFIHLRRLQTIIHMRIDISVVRDVPLSDVCVELQSP